MRARRLAVLAAAVGLSACAAAKVKPTGAGSTEVLRMLRDWRGVWSGSVQDSPMGKLSYTLYVEEMPGARIRARMAPQRDADLDDMRHSYELAHFDAGTPAIHYALAQRNARHEGDLGYRAELSGDDEAVFCAEEGGCDKVQLIFARLSPKKVQLRSMVHESGHALIDLEFTSSEVPRDGHDETPKPTIKRTRMKPSEAKQRPSDDALDIDLGEADSIEAKQRRREHDEQQR
jgi:hypothetical protein